MIGCLRNVGLVAAVLLTAAACERRRGTSSPPSTAPAGNLVFHDAAGDVVATADLDLPDELPAADGEFHGKWKLLSSEPAFPSGSTKSGSYKGSVHDGLFSIDLNPGAADNNVVLGWTPKTDPITGTWYHATFAGGKPMGTFNLFP